MKIGFAGAGNMAAAMARGWARADGGPEAMLFCDLDADRAQALAEEVGGEPRRDLSSLAAGSDVLVLAVKPVGLDTVAAELGHAAPPILSVLAATTLDRIAEAFPGVPALRLMPNQPAEVGAGVLVYAEPRGFPDELADELVGLLSALGTPVLVPEEQIDAAMAMMSCAPAYVALFARVLADAGAREGLPAEVSLELVARTLSGTASLLAQKEPNAIIAAVAPRGGATEAGLEALRAGGFTDAVEAAVDASLERFR